MGDITVRQLKRKAEKVDELLKEAAMAELALLETATSPMFGGKTAVVGWLAMSDDVTDKKPVIDLVKGLAKVDSKEYGDAADAVKDVVSPAHGTALNALNEEIDGIKAVFTPDMWDGETARSYSNNHLNAYSDIITQQIGALGELHGAMTGFKALLDEAYSSLDQVLDGSKEALEAIIEGAEGKVTQVAFAAIGAVVGIAGAAATGGGSLAVTFAIANGGVAVGSTFVNGGGADTDTVYDNVTKAIDTLQDQIDEFDGELADKLTDDQQQIDLLLDVGLSGINGQVTPIEIPRPAFADDPSKL